MIGQSPQALVVPTPPEFALAWSHDKPDGSLQMREFVPQGQTVETWQQMITVQHFPKLSQVEPQALLGRWTQSVLAACPKAQISREPQSPVNGHPAMRVYVHVTECGARAPESILAVVIKGADAMHMVQHAHARAAAGGEGVVRPRAAVRDGRRGLRAVSGSAA